MPKSQVSDVPDQAIDAPQINLPVFDTNTSPSHLLHRAQQIAADLHVAAFGTVGLTQRQLAVLSALGAKSGVSQTDLVLTTGIDRSTLAEMVARMEAKGLMVRAKSATDSRANSVSLTPEGEAALAEAVPKMIEIDRGVLALLPNSRRESLIDLLIRIALPKEGKVKSEAKPKKKDKDKKKKDRKKKKVEKT